MTAFTLSLFLFGCPGFPAQVAAEHLSCGELTDSHKIHRNHHMGPLMFSFRPTKAARRNKTGSFICFSNDSVLLLTEPLCFVLMCKFRAFALGRWGLLFCCWAVALAGVLPNQCTPGQGDAEDSSTQTVHTTDAKKRKAPSCSHELISPFFGSNHSVSVHVTTSISKLLDYNLNTNISKLQIEESQFLKHKQSSPPPKPLNRTSWKLC